MYPLFKGPKSKQKLSKDFDQFDRDHSPLYEKDRYARDYHLARAEVDKVLAKVGPLDGPLWDASRSELIQELESRKKMITEGDRLKKDVNRVLDKMEEYSTRMDEESTRLRTEIKDHVLSILPQTKERFDRIDAVIQSELNRLTSANTQLTIENTALKAQAGTSKVTGELESLVQRVNKRDEQDAQELASLRKVPGEFELAKQAWDREKGTLEQNEEKLQKELESMQRQRDEWKAHSEGQDKEVEAANRSKEDAEANVASVLQQKEEVDGQLKHVKASAEGEKRRADALQGELKEARSELEELQRRIATPRSLDAAGRDNHELFVLRQEAAKWATWRNNRVAEVERLKKEKEELTRESATLRTKVDELELKALYSEELERQRSAQVSDLGLYRDELVDKVSGLNNDILSKDSEIAKLRRKHQISDNNFEWVKGRMLEYYGMHQTGMRDNQQLRESNEQLCGALQRSSAALTRKTTQMAKLREEKKRLEQSLDGADNLVEQLNQEKAGLDVEKLAKDDLIGRMSEAGRGLEKEKAAWLEEQKKLQKSVDEWKNSAQNLEAEKAALEEEKNNLEGRITKLHQDKSTLEGTLEEERTAWLSTTREMESSAATLMEALHQGRAAWQDEKDVLQLHLEGAQNAAIDHWARCASLTADNADQARSLAAELATSRHWYDRYLTANTNLWNANNQLTVTTNERNAVRADLAMRTEQRDAAAADLATISNERELATQKAEEWKEKWEEEKNRREDAEGEPRGLRDDVEMNHRDGACVTKGAFGEVQDQLQDLRDDMEMNHSNEACVTKAAHTQLRQTCEALQRNLDTNHSEEACVAKNLFDQVQQELESWKNDHGDCVPYSEFTSLDRALNNLTVEHGQCTNADVVQQLRDFHAQHGTCVDRATYDNLSNAHAEEIQAYKAVLTEHQQCPSSDQVQAYRDVLTAHDECPTADHKQAVNDFLDAHSECPTPEEVKAYEAVATAHQQCPTAEEIQGLRDFRSQHGACIDRDVYDGVLNAHQQCPTAEDVHRLREFQFQHGTCVDRALYNNVLNEHQQCPSAEQVQAYNNVVNEHQHCPSAEQVQAYNNVLTEHQQCPSAEEIQGLRNFQSQHGSCVDQDVFDDLSIVHQQCPTAEDIQQLRGFQSQHGNCVDSATLTNLQQEFENFRTSHAGCDELARQLGQLQEEHGQCARQIQELTATTTMGSSGTPGRFQVPSTPRSQQAVPQTNLRLSIPNSPGYSSLYGRDGSPSPVFSSHSPTMGAFQSQSPGGFGQGFGQTSPSTGTFGQQPSPTFGQSQSSPTFGPPLQQPTAGYSFLISGQLATGPRTMAVNPSAIQMMNAFVAKLNSRTKDKSHWSTKTSVSHKRCIDTRIVSHLTLSQNPPASENPNEACASCVNKGIPCVLIDGTGVVVVPLPVSARSIGATPTSGEYFVKQK